MILKSRRLRFLFIGLSVLLLIGGFAIYKMNFQEKNVLLHTNMGDITIQLDKNMPITAGNFEKLVKQGFYNGVIFHRVIDGFMI